jgi:microcystin-dependent protein
MARPTVAHTGIFVPNAQDVAYPQMAEPDRIDYNTLGNSRWGVISGCQVSVSGSTATVTGGIAKVNGTLVTVAAGQSASHGTGGTQDRYDVVGVDTNGTLVVVRGGAAVDPVFPDPPTNITALAAVFCNTGASDYGDNVIDKRNFILDSLLTSLSGSANLIYNQNGTGALYNVTGDGTTTWAGDTWIQRAGQATLKVHSNLTLDGGITAATDISARNLTASAKVTGTNLVNGTSIPASGTTGDLYQDGLTGRVYVWRNNQWDELATLSTSVPVGSVLTSLQDPATMGPLGWVPLDGRTVNETTYPTLFTIPALTTYITGTAPNRSMTLPDARRRVLLTDFTGEAGRVGGSSTLALGLANLPAHKHNTKTLSAGSLSLTARTGRAGSHRHSVTGGEHGHAVNDPGHQHAGMDFFGYQSPVIALMWGGQNKIDALFNDRSHTYSVDQMLWTSKAVTGLTISSSGSWHVHEVDVQGDHDHAIVIDPVAAHVHNVTEDTVGSGTPVDTTPAYLAVYTYVRS